MKQVKIFINHPFEAEIRYTLSVMEDMLDCKFEFTQTQQSGSILITQNADSHIAVNTSHFQKLAWGDAQWQNFFTDGGSAICKGKPDYIFSIFYIINSYQEHKLKQYDKYNRLKTEDTWQSQFNLIKTNIAGQWIKEFAAVYLSEFDVRVKDFKSRIFLSHDIDSVYGSFLQDSFWCLKRYRVGDMFKIFLDAVAGRHAWFNMDRIMQIESMYDFRSTFFWIVTQKRGNFNLVNADYDIHNEKVISAQQRLTQGGWTNGLHKSAAASSFKEELAQFPEKGITANRFHYLLFNLPDGYKRIGESGLKFDTSLGFPDTIGFRNSYSLPFKPYDLSTRKTYGFVECPLHIMDTTYHFYNKLGAERLVEDSIKFIESHNINSVISVLFHNNYVSDFKFGEYIKAFKKLLSYFYESGFKSISPEEVTKTYLREY